MLVSVDHSLYLVDRNKADKQIEWILLSDYQFWTFFLYKCDIYDEESDGIQLVKALKVSWFVFFLIINSNIKIDKKTQGCFCFFICNFHIDKNSSKND